MRGIAGIALELACAAAIVACGASSMKAPASPAVASPAPVGERGELDALDAQIRADLDKLGLEPGAPVCTGAACDAVALGRNIRTVAASCEPKPSETCTDVCTLKDAICENAGKICRIAGELSGADAYANERCTAGNASCEAAAKKCCDCA